MPGLRSFAIYEKNDVSHTFMYETSIVFGKQPACLIPISKNVLNVAEWIPI